MKIVPFEAPHAWEVALNTAMPTNIVDLAPWVAVQNSGLAWTGISENGEVLGVAGFFVIGDTGGVAHCFTYLTDNIDKYGVALTRHVMKRLLTMQEVDHRFWRISADVAVGDETAVRWAERLGFEREGIQRGRGDKQEDYYLYARVRKW